MGGLGQLNQSSVLKWTNQFIRKKREDSAPLEN